MLKIEACGVVAAAVFIWYLMMPSGSYYHALWSSPKRDWTITGIFESQSDCTRVVRRLRADAYGGSAVDRPEKFPTDRNFQEENAQCVQAADPVIPRSAPRKRK